MENSDKDTYSYDGHGQLIKDLYQTWDNGTSAWKNRSQYKFTYDGQGAWTKELYQNWDAGSSSWINDSKFELTNNNNGMPIFGIAQYWNSGSSQWENDEKDSLAYDANNNVIFYGYFDWQAGNWMPGERNTYTYDNNNNCTSQLVEEGNGNSWEYAGKLLCTYQSNNMTETLIKFWNPSAHQLKDSIRYTYAFNNDHQCTSIVEEIYDGASWSSVYQNEKYIFHYEPMGTKINEVLDEDNFSLYPNPAGQEMTLEMDKRPINAIRIMDLSGRIVFSTQSPLKAHKVSVPVQNLTDGIYILQVESRGQTGSKTFVVKH